MKEPRGSPAPATFSKVPPPPRGKCNPSFSFPPTWGVWARGAEMARLGISSSAPCSYSTGSHLREWLSIQGLRPDTWDSQEPSPPTQSVTWSPGFCLQNKPKVPCWHSPTELTWTTVASSLASLPLLAAPHILHTTAWKSKKKKTKPRGKGWGGKGRWEGAQDGGHR